MEIALVMVALIGYVAFRQYLQHHRRIMIHRERMVAIEKGVELPPLEKETQRSTWNVQRVLLLLGWSWIAVGVGVFTTITAILQAGGPEARGLHGTQYVGLGLACVGVAHLITYWVGARRERGN